MKLFAYLFLLLCSITVPVIAAQPIKIISSFPVGSGPDTLSRKVASQIAAQLQVPVIIENRPGGNGAVAMINAINEKDSENVILYASNDNLVVYPLLINDYRLINNFKPLKEAFWTELVLASGPDVKNIKEIFQSGRVSYGSWGVGSAPHLMASELASTQGHRDSVHVPYKDYGAWFTDIGSGVLSFSFVTVASTSNLEKAGKLKYHAIVGPSRITRYPNVPTLKELTNHSMNLVGWAGFYTNESMSINRAQELKAAMDRAYKSQEVLETVKALNYNVRDLSSIEFGNNVKQDQEKYKDVIRRYSIKID
jgi:tripartite-type tricarboxylate transporter receptor subunit TctC